MIEQSQKDPYRWIILILGTTSVFGALGLARFGYSAVLPAMQQGLGMSNTQAGIMATANLAGYLALSAIGGALASQFGARLIVSLGLLLCGAGMLLTGMSGTFAVAVFWRVITGFGSGAANIGAMGMWATWFEPNRRGTAAGIAVTGSSFALIFTGPMAPYIISSFGSGGWRACWYVFGAITLALAALCAIALKNRPAPGPAMPVAEKSPGQTGRGWANVYGSWPVWHLGLVYIAFGFSYIIYMTFFVKYLAAEHGYTRQAAGNVFMLMGICSLACGLVWGTVSDRIGRKQTLVIIYLIQCTAFAFFALWHTHAGLALSAVLFGITAWSIPAIMAATCGDVLGAKLAPAGLGFITLFFGIGQATAPSMAGALADKFGSFSPAFLLAAGVALVGAIAAVGLNKSNK
jgi:predicted MFS family arabinose efflux permease